MEKQTVAEMKTGTITLRKMAARIAEIMAENDKRYPAENRNDLPVTVELPVYGPLKQNGRRSYKHTFRTLEGVRGDIYTIDGQKYMVVVAQAETKDKKEQLGVA